MDSKKKKGRRAFLKKGGLITLGTLGAYGVSNSLLSSVLPEPASGPPKLFQNNKFILVPLPYDYRALEPYIDKATMEIHYQRHHATYVVNLNKAIENLTIPYDFEELMGSISNYPAVIRNNGGGHYNHTLFWGLMAAKAGGKPAGRLSDAIHKDFGSFENFKTKFTETAMKHFGSGWTWLVIHKGKLEIGTTANQDNPVMDISAFRGKPLLCLDIWEHAYYLKYENRRKEYIEAWWNVVNWE